MHSDKNTKKNVEDKRKKRFNHGMEHTIGLLKLNIPIFHQSLHYI